MENYSADKVIIATGATSGIGRAVALRFANASARIVAIGRNRSALEAVAREIKSAGGDPPGEPDDVFRLARRELHRAQIPHPRSSEPLRLGKAIDGVTPYLDRRAEAAQRHLGDDCSEQFQREFEREGSNGFHPDVSAHEHALL